MERSPLKYFMGELYGGNSLRSTISVGNEKKRQKVYNTMFHVPLRCERVLIHFIHVSFIFSALFPESQYFFFLFTPSNHWSIWVYPSWYNSRVSYPFTHFFLFLFLLQPNKEPHICTNVCILSWLDLWVMLAFSVFSIELQGVSYQ